MYDFKTPSALVSRLTEVEKSKIRQASPAGLTWLYHNQYYPEIKSEAELQEVQAEVNEIYRVNSLSPVFGCTWKF